MSLQKWKTTDINALKKLLYQNNEIDFLNFSFKDESAISKLKLGTKNKEKNIQLLITYKRLLKIAPSTDFEILATLLKDGLFSALQIAATPQQKFLEKYSTIFGNDIAKATQFYENASAIRTKVLLSFMNKKQSKKVLF